MLIAAQLPQDSHGDGLRVDVGAHRAVGYALLDVRAQVGGKRSSRSVKIGSEFGRGGAGPEQQERAARPPAPASART